MVGRRMVQFLVAASLVVAQTWAAYCAPSCQPALAEPCCRNEQADKSCCCTLQAKATDRSPAVLAQVAGEAPAVLSHGLEAPIRSFAPRLVEIGRPSSPLALRIELGAESPRGPPSA